jgi:hypothetical protein
MKKFEQSILNKKPIIWSANNMENGKLKGILGKQIEARIKKESESMTKKDQVQSQKSLASAITYFTNNTAKSRMNYAENVALNYPIGSGVTEAACKTIVKQRLGQSGMQWKDKGAGVILSLRALSHSTGRWEQFWNKVNQCGLSMAA